VTKTDTNNVVLFCSPKSISLYHKKKNIYVIFYSRKEKKPSMAMYEMITFTRKEDLEARRNSGFFFFFFFSRDGSGWQRRPKAKR
jgi:hypothetical protein